MSKAFFPLLGTYGPAGVDHLAEQVRQTIGDHEVSVVERDDVAFDPKVHWRTREGAVLLIVTMSDDHLRNTLRMLHRTSVRWMWSMVNARPVNEDGPACEVAEELASAKPDELIVLRKQHHQSLVDEWARRGYERNAWH